MLGDIARTEALSDLGLGQLAGGVRTLGIVCDRRFGAMPL
jgi:hypothetical protein